MYRVTSPVLVFITSIALSGCGNWNVQSNLKSESKTDNRVGVSGIVETSSGFRDGDTGDIIRQERDENGNLRDCSIGSSSDRRGLPSCNDIVNRRDELTKTKKAVSQGLLRNKVDGSNLFVTPSGAKFYVRLATKYNDEMQVGRGGGELILNGVIERHPSTSQAAFKSLFIQSPAFIEFAFMDGDNFELLDSLRVPLDLQRGAAQNIRYRKKFGSTTDDVVGVSFQARKPLRSIREYKEIASIDVGFKPR
jgi:hypothetical protein